MVKSICNTNVLFAGSRQDQDKQTYENYYMAVFNAFDYAVYEQFDYKRIVRLHSYNIANDKAFAISGIQSYALLKSPQLTHPRIDKSEIKNIILGGGQNFLSPERRFDAVIVYSPELFD